MRIHTIDPTKDARWADLVEKYPDASVFHTVGWLEALKRTYGYKPVVFTTSSPTGALKNGLVFCHIKSWLTGSRLVSLPFSDHCEPLFDSREELDFLVRYLRTALEHENWQYLEVRSISNNSDAMSDDGDGVRPPVTYFLHILDLRPDLDKVFRLLDKDSVQRRIHRANRANLVEQSGTSDEVLRKFYDLFALTRGRHQLPPIPYAWFQNLTRCLGDAVHVRVAHQDRQAVAAILTLRFKNVLYYKYGGSDKRYNYLGATPWLLWNSVRAARAAGATAFNLGRTEADNAGLLAFKNHWVQPAQQLVYGRFPSISGLDSPSGWRLKVAKRVFSFMPDKLLALTGRILYRHIG
jgi:Acetyltransferase (GNAT) domain